MTIAELLKSSIQAHEMFKASNHDQKSEDAFNKLFAVSEGLLHHIDSHRSREKAVESIIESKTGKTVPFDDIVLALRAGKVAITRVQSRQ